MKLLGKIILFVSFSLAACPEENMYEDSCGNCWLPYCYNYVTHEIAYDIDEVDCTGGQSMWVIPGDAGDPYFNNYCNDTCPDDFMLDDCGHCWQSFCYTFFNDGLNGDPEHSVYYDLSAEECEDYGFNYYTPDHSSSPHWNSNCSNNANCGSGDVNEDEVLNVVDLVQIVSYILSSETASEEQLCISDINEDGIINVVDIVGIVSMILGDV